MKLHQQFNRWKRPTNSSKSIPAPTMQEVEDAVEKVRTARKIREAQEQTAIEDSVQDILLSAQASIDNPMRDKQDTLLTDSSLASEIGNSSWEVMQREAEEANKQYQAKLTVLASGSSKVIGQLHSLLLPRFPSFRFEIQNKGNNRSILKGASILPSPPFSYAEGEIDGFIRGYQIAANDL